jgi:hypothetical protein
MSKSVISAASALLSASSLPACKLEQDIGELQRAKERDAPPLQQLKKSPPMEDIGGLFQGLYGMSTLSGMTSPTVRSSVTFVPAVVKLRIALYSSGIEYVTRCLCRCYK